MHNESIMLKATHLNMWVENFNQFRDFKLKI